MHEDEQGDYWHFLQLDGKDQVVTEVGGRIVGAPEEGAKHFVEQERKVSKPAPGPLRNVALRVVTVQSVSAFEHFLETGRDYTASFRADVARVVRSD